jgi:hypothetical protein
MVMPFLMASCFVTRYVSEEKDLRRQFAGSDVEKVEMELGEPDEVINMQNGYTYVYYISNSRGTVTQDIRIIFNKNGLVRAAWSTITKPERSFDGKSTGFLIAVIILVDTICAIALLSGT